MSLSLNATRLSTMPSPPRQDRVRSIRNSVLGSQRRGLAEDSPMSSRANSLAPETTKNKGASEHRQTSRPPETQFHYVEMFPEDESEESSASNLELTLPPNGENMEFFIALSLPSRVKSQYAATIKHFKKPMKEFLSGNIETDTVQSMRRLVQRLNNVSTHVDLENEEWEKTQNEPTEDQTKWTLSSGSKFVFLNSLCNFLRDRHVHITILAGEPRILYLLERFMQGIHVDYVRPDSGKRTLSSSSQSRLKVSIISTAPTAQLGPWSSTHVVVAFDESFDANVRHIRTLRANSPAQGGVAPVVHPMIYCSAEHLGRCIDELEEFKTDLDRLRAHIVAIDERQTEIAEMQPDDFRPDAAGEEVGHFVVEGGGRNNWTTMAVRPVRVLGLDTLLQDDLVPANAVQDVGQATSPNSRKRPSEVEDSPSDKRPGLIEQDIQDDIEGQKRLRMSPITEVTRLSESTLTSQMAQVDELRQALQVAEAARHAADHASTLQLGKLEATLLEREQSLVDQGKGLDELQSRYEKARRAIRKLQADKVQLTEQIAATSRRTESMAAANDQLKEANRKLVVDLEAVRAELTGSQVPEVAQLEQLRAENRTLLGRNEAMERKAKSVAQDFEFTRQQYQQASGAASDHWARIQELEQENAALRQKASGEAVRLRELTNRKEVETYTVENARLRAENDELKEHLKRKERGRGMTTRTGSVAPRSPRLGASPGRSRAGSRAPGSRPQSPVRSIYSARRGRGLVEQSF